MQMSGNTILITGGGSGIGRGLAEAFHRHGNDVIIAGRRQSVLDDVTAANPGMQSVTFDIGSAEGIKRFAEELGARFPKLNVLINNAGIMPDENIKEAPAYLQTAEDTIVTNLLGPIRLTAALLPQLMRQPHSAVLTVSSGLAFVPLAVTPTYSATKAAIHSYSMSLRHQLKDTSTEVIEIAPPYVQTHLRGEHQASDPNAMPLDEFVAETMAILSSGEKREVIVERCKPLRYAEKSGTIDTVFGHLNP